MLPSYAIVQPVDENGAPIPWQPTPEWRQFVEIMVMLGHSQEAIVREFKHRNLPVNRVETLQRLFRDELEFGKERRLAGYGVKLHSIAMGDTPQALSALKFLLATQGGAQWRIPKDVDPTDERNIDAALEREVVHFYIPQNGRDQPEPEETAPTIEGEALRTDDAA